MTTWFDQLFDEFKARGEAMFAFSRSQVEDQGVSWAELQSEWSSVGGSGLLVKKSARGEFLRRMNADHDAWRAELPELRVRYIGESTLDYPAYRALHAVESLGVKEHQLLVDIEYAAPGEVEYLHTTASEDFPEPGHQLEARIVCAEIEAHDD